MQCISNRIFIFDDVYNDVADDDNGGADDDNDSWEKFWKWR